MFDRNLSQEVRDAVASARAIAPLVSQAAQAAQDGRTLPLSTVEAMKQAGLFRLFQPKEVGGTGGGIVAQILVAEEVSRADGSAGWIVIANGPSAGFSGAYLGDDCVAEVFPSDHETCFAGQFAPNGQGQAVDGGFRISGAWNFGSGVGHSEYIMGGFVLMRGDEMVMLDDGMPDMRVACFRREQVELTDGWHVMGLQGTGSYDYRVNDAIVPDSWTYPLFTRRRKRGNALYSLGLYPVTAGGHAGWALGVARRAMDEIRTLAREKTRMGFSATISERTTFQRDYIQAESKLSAARLLVLDVFDEMEALAEAGGTVGAEERARMRSAATYATEVCKEVVDFAHLSAGTTAIRDGSALQRCFRDMHTGTQHTFIGEETYLESAQILLGLRTEASPAL